jgi:hypothetical protein
MKFACQQACQPASLPAYFKSLPTFQNSKLLNFQPFILPAFQPVSPSSLQPSLLPAFLSSNVLALQPASLSDNLQPGLTICEPDSQSACHMASLKTNLLACHLITFQMLQCRRCFPSIPSTFLLFKKYFQSFVYFFSLVNTCIYLVLHRPHTNPFLYVDQPQREGVFTGTGNFQFVCVCIRCPKLEGGGAGVL